MKTAETVTRREVFLTQKGQCQTACQPIVLKGTKEDQRSQPFFRQTEEGSDSLGSPSQSGFLSSEQADQQSCSQYHNPLPKRTFQ
jgi:hypothetical protein